MPSSMDRRRVAANVPNTAHKTAHTTALNATAHARGGRRSIAFGAIALAFLLAAAATAFASTSWSDESRQLRQLSDAVELTQIRIDLSRAAQDEFVLSLIAPLGAATQDQIDDARLERERANTNALDALRSIENSNSPTRREARALRSELDSFNEFVEEATPDDLYDLVLLTEFAGEESRIGGTEQIIGIAELGSLDQLVTLLLGEAAVIFHIDERPAADQGVTDHVDSIAEWVADAGGYLGPDESAPIRFAVIPSEVATEFAPDATSRINASIRSTSLWEVDQWVQSWEGGEITPAPISFGALVSETFAARDEIRAITDDRIAGEIVRIDDRTNAIATRVLLLRVGAGALLVVALGAAAAAIQAIRRRSMLLFDQANTDPLTGVGNRHMLTSAAEVALRDERFTDHLVVMVDLDRFKMTNDTYGHAVGDRILVAVADQLTGLVGSLGLTSGSVIRLGGDEFAVFLHHVGPIDSDRVRHSVEAIRRTTVSTNDGDDRTDATGDEITVELSYGIAHASGPVDLAELLDAADLEAYNEKSARRERSERPTISTDGISIRS